MAVRKVVELMGYSEKSWDDAAQQIVTEAAKTIKNIESIYVHDMSAKVVDNKITQYRINGRVTFRVGADDREDMA